MFIVFLVPPLTSRKPYESTYTSTASQTFSDSTQQIIFLSENHHVRTMSLCIKRRKNESWNLSNLSSLPAHLPKTSHFDFVKACSQVDEPNGSQRTSHLISAFQCLFFWCARLYLVCFFSKHNNSRKSWYKIPMTSPPSKIHLPFFHDLNKVPAASCSCWHYVGKKRRIQYL